MDTNWMTNRCTYRYEYYHVDVTSDRVTRFFFFFFLIAITIIIIIIFLFYTFHFFFFLIIQAELLCGLWKSNCIYILFFIL